ncbi:MAG TPA: nucleotide sugar dehydrogenase [Gaiellales bacterium]|jgi:UDP-N-acetyl-D-glucosamine dehydrogenase|nr:nucleotide sugar dehydrogenase [Gaiellales bacterium]
MSTDIAIVGAGYVGLPLAVEFARVGRTVVCIEADPRKVEAIRRGTSYVEDVPGADLAAFVEAGTLSATGDFAAVADADAVLICLPTPLSRNREPDLSILTAATHEIARHVRAGQLVVLESTTYPGTTRDVLRPVLEAGGLVAGKDFHLAMSPERIDPGRTDYTIRTTPKVVGGLTPACLDRALEMYRACCEHLVPVSSCEAAELTKLLENIFRSVNIALVNELAMLCDRMSLNVWEVVAAAASKPYGFMPFQPGPGLGGHCLPIDPFYLSWKARELDFPTEFIELAGKVNQHMPYYCAERVARALNEHRKAVAGSTVLVLGVAYKGDVGDLRESPALKLIELLRERGAEVVYHDPFVPDLGEEGLTLESAELTDELLGGADIVCVVTAHSGIDYARVAGRAQLVLDLRNAVPAADERVVKL